MTNGRNNDNEVSTEQIQIYNYKNKHTIVHYTHDCPQSVVCTGTTWWRTGGGLSASHSRTNDVTRKSQSRLSYREPNGECSMLRVFSELPSTDQLQVQPAIANRISCLYGNYYSADSAIQYITAIIIIIINIYFAVQRVVSARNNNMPKCQIKWAIPQTYYILILLLIMGNTHCTVLCKILYSANTVHAGCYQFTTAIGYLEPWTVVVTIPLREYNIILMLE